MNWQDEERRLKYLNERNAAKNELAKVWPTKAEDVPDCIDQWIAQVNELFGKGSCTSRLLVQAYDAAVLEAKEIEEQS